MRVSDIMSPNVAGCETDSLVPEAARLMCQNDCGSIPVLDGQRRPIGIVTDRDITCRGVAQGRDMQRTAVGEIMTKPVVTVGRDTSVDDCCELMEERQIRRVLVVD